MKKEEIYALFDAKDIWYEVTRHGAVYTMADLAKVAIPYPEADAKNLFVRDDKKQMYYLITVQGEKRVDLKAFRRANGTRPLSFASEEELWDKLRLTAGSVTPLGLLHDENREVALYIDSALAEGKIGCHPLDNTETVWMRTRDLIALLEEHGNSVHIVEI